MKDLLGNQRGDTRSGAIVKELAKFYDWVDRHIADATRAVSSPVLDREGGGR